MALTELDLEEIKDRNRHWAVTGEGGDVRTWKDVDALVNEVERLQGQVDDLVVALDAEQDEVVRLADGIRQHREAESREWGPVESRPAGYEPEDEDLALWALIEERTETT